MTEKEAIKNIKTQLVNTKKANECGLATKGEFNEDIEAIETVLNLLDKKDAVIDLMARMMAEARVGRRAFTCDFEKECNENGCRTCIKQYFENKVEE